MFQRVKTETKYESGMRTGRRLTSGHRLLSKFGKIVYYLDSGLFYLQVISTMPEMHMIISTIHETVQYQPLALELGLRSQNIFVILWVIVKKIKLFNDSWSSIQ